MRTITRGTFLSTGIFFETKNIQNLDFDKKIELLNTLCSDHVYNFGATNWDKNSLKEQKMEHAELHLIDGNSDAYESIHEAESSKILKRFNLPEAIDLAIQVIKSNEIPKGNQVTIYLNESLRIHGNQSALRIEHHPANSYEATIHGVASNSKGFKQGDGIIGTLLKNG